MKNAETSSYISRLWFSR